MLALMLACAVPESDDTADWVADDKGACPGITVSPGSAVVVGGHTARLSVTSGCTAWAWVSGPAWAFRPDGLFPLATGDVIELTTGPAWTDAGARGLVVIHTADGDVRVPVVLAQ